MIVLVIVGLVILGLLPDLFDYMRVRQTQGKASSKGSVKRYSSHFAEMYKRVRNYLPR